jgi:lauroyl/myristoyl acyltransferase
MAAPGRRGWFLHPRHPWRGVRIDRSGFWPMVTLGWWTLEILPAGIAHRVSDVLAALRGPLERDW